jgi:hypothetical protein
MDGGDDLEAVLPSSPLEHKRANHHALEGNMGNCGGGGNVTTRRRTHSQFMGSISVLEIRAKTRYKPKELDYSLSLKTVLISFLEPYILCPLLRKTAR